MIGHAGFTRRRVLTTSLAGTAALATSSNRALAAPALVKGSKLTFWGGLIFSDKANKLLVETIRKWGVDNGIQADVVMINQNETVQKVSAAMASNTMPDALDLAIDLLLDAPRREDLRRRIQAAARSQLYDRMDVVHSFEAFADEAIARSRRNAPR